MLNNPLPKLHRMAHQLNPPEISVLSQHKETGGSMMPTQQLQEVGGPSGISPHINSPPSKSKQKRPAVTTLQNHSAAKRVKKNPIAKDPNAKRRQTPASKKHLKSPPTKRVPSPIAEVQLRTPVITRSPMLRLLVSPVVVGVRSPTPPSHHLQRSPTPPSHHLQRSPTPPSHHLQRSPTPPNIPDNINNEDIPCTSIKIKIKMLRDMLKNCNSRVSLTADAWSSKGNTGYFCITCHYIDDKWKVQKKIIRFCYIKTPHDALNLYNVMLKSIRYYNIEDKLFSVTLDNAQANTSMVNSLCEHLFIRQLIPSGDLFHVRCAAHVLNLIVKDGLQTLEGVIDNIRESVKYIKASQSRKEKFEEIIAELGISCKKRPSLDVPTRWNSTYLMLKSALPLRLAFHELKRQDLNYNNCPLSIEWNRAEVVCNLLKVFKRGTEIVSGSKYPTANLYFHQIWEVRQALQEGALSSNVTITAMVKEMQKKFDKYWDFSYLSNCIPVVLDPRFKFGFVDFRLRQAFGGEANFHIRRVHIAVTNLFNAYSSPTQDTSVEQGGNSTRQGCPWSNWSDHLSAQARQGTNELDRYLHDDLFPCDKDDFDILHWWKMHSPMYPTLARIARDVLAVPASTVASESAFSTSSRVISDYRSSLSTGTVEALLCLQDWFQAAGSSYSHILSSKNLDGDEDFDL